MSLTQTSTLVEAGGSSRPRKRVRTKGKEKTAQVSSPKDPKDQLFAPFRALGFISNHVPFVLQVRTYKGSSDPPRLHILTCLGKAWALWEGGKMTLLFVGMLLSRFVSCFTAEGYTRTGYGGTDIIFGFGWRCCLGNSWFVCIQISERQRGILYC